MPMDAGYPLNQENVQSEASEVIRGLIDEIRLLPDDGVLKIELYGDLAGMLALANNSPTSDNEVVQVTMVAGARNHRELTLPGIEI